MTAQSLPCDWGGSGPALHLAHANGFPPGSYAPLAQHLAVDFHTIALPARPLWPGSQPQEAPDWHVLADDLMRGLDTLDLQGILGAGHSLGGVCTLLAAVRRPELFKAIVLIDPVILPPPWLWVLRLMRWLGLERWQPLVRTALHRRQTWPNRQACFEHYREKSFFARWSDASLWAYVATATHQRDDGSVRLIYPVAWEAHIFATTPTDIWHYVPQLTMPLFVISGQHSNTFRPSARAKMARQLPRAHFHILPEAGHMVPLERPVKTAAAMREFFTSI